MASARGRSPLEIGATAPDFELCDLTGGLQSLGGLLARGPALLAFFKVSCPTCQLTLPFLDRLSASSQLQVVGISQDAADFTREFNDEFGVRFPTLLDAAESGYTVSNAFGITHVPTLFLVERDRRISASQMGFSRQWLEDVGQRAGIAPFRQDEAVPEWKAG